MQHLIFMNACMTGRVTVVAILEQNMLFGRATIVTRPVWVRKKRACKNVCRPAQSARQQASVRVWKNHWSHIFFTGQLYEADSSDIIIIVTKKVIYQYMHMYSNMVIYQYMLVYVCIYAYGIYTYIYMYVWVCILLQ